ncbi:hypothetical protein MKY95_10245 [Paenibacillus sp. FSL P4-0176]
MAINKELFAKAFYELVKANRKTEDQVPKELLEEFNKLKMQDIDK